MEYNKRQFKKSGDKKVLHKIKKRWVVVSAALLMAIGGEAVAAHVTHAASNPDNSNQSNDQLSGLSQSNHQLTMNQSRDTDNNVSNNQPASATSRSNITDQARALHQSIILNSTHNQNNSLQNTNTNTRNNANAQSNSGNSNESNDSNLNNNDSNHTYRRVTPPKNRLLGMHMMRRLSALGASDVDTTGIETVPDSKSSGVLIKYEDASDGDKVVNEDGESTPPHIPYRLFEKLNAIPQHYYYTGVKDINNIPKDMWLNPRSTYRNIPRLLWTPRDKKWLVIDVNVAKAKTVGTGTLNVVYERSNGQEISQISTSGRGGSPIQSSDIQKLVHLVPKGYEFDKLPAGETWPTNYPKSGNQQLYVMVGHNGIINVNYMYNNQLIHSNQSSDVLNNAFNVERYESANYIPQGYQYANVSGPVPKTYIDTPQTVTINLTKSSVPSKPTVHHETIRYVQSMSDGGIDTIKSFQPSANNSDTPIDYNSMNQVIDQMGYQVIPSDANDHFDQYIDNGTSTVYVKKNAPKPVPKPTPQPKGTATIIYQDAKNHTQVGNPINASGVIGQKINYDLYTNQDIPANYEFAGYGSHVSDFGKNPSTDYLMVNPIEGSIDVRYVNNNDRSQVITNDVIHGTPGESFTSLPNYEQNVMVGNRRYQYVGVGNGYNINQFTANPQTIDVLVEPVAVPKQKGTITLNYDKSDGGSFSKSFTSDVGNNFDPSGLVNKYIPADYHFSNYINGYRQGQGPIKYTANSQTINVSIRRDKGSINVTYMTPNSNKPLAHYTLTGDVGNSFNPMDYAQSNIPRAGEYKFDRITQGSDINSYGSTPQNLVVQIEKKTASDGSIDVNYVDVNSNQQIGQTIHLTGVIGSKFNSNAYTDNNVSKNEPNYHYVKMLSNNVDTFNRNPQSLTVGIAHDVGHITIYYRYGFGHNVHEIAKPVTLTGESGTPFKGISNYVTQYRDPNRDDYVYEGISQGNDVYNFNNGNQDIVAQLRRNPINQVTIDYYSPINGVSYGKDIVSGRALVPFNYQPYITPSSQGGKLPKGLNYTGQIGNQITRYSPVTTIIYVNKAQTSSAANKKSSAAAPSSKSATPSSKSKPTSSSSSQPTPSSSSSAPSSSTTPSSTSSSTPSSSTTPSGHSSASSSAGSSTSTPSSSSSSAPSSSTTPSSTSSSVPSSSTTPSGHSSASSSASSSTSAPSSSSSSAPSSSTTPSSTSSSVPSSSTTPSGHSSASSSASSSTSAPSSSSSVAPSSSAIPSSASSSTSSSNTAPSSSSNSSQPSSSNVTPSSGANSSQTSANSSIASSISSAISSAKSSASAASSQASHDNSVASSASSRAASMKSSASSYQSAVSSAKSSASAASSAASSASRAASTAKASASAASSQASYDRSIASSASSQATSYHSAAKSTSSKATSESSAGIHSAASSDSTKASNEASEGNKATSIASSDNSVARSASQAANKASSMASVANSKASSASRSASAASSAASAVSSKASSASQAASTAAAVASADSSIAGSEAHVASVTSTAASTANSLASSAGSSKSVAPQIITSTSTSVQYVPMPIYEPTSGSSQAPVNIINVPNSASASPRSTAAVSNQPNTTINYVDPNGKPITSQTVAGTSPDMSQYTQNVPSGYRFDRILGTGSLANGDQVATIELSPVNGASRRTSQPSHSKPSSESDPESDDNGSDVHEPSDSRPEYSNQQDQEPVNESRTPVNEAMDPVSSFSHGTMNNGSLNGDNEPSSTTQNHKLPQTGEASEDSKVSLGFILLALSALIANLGHAMDRRRDK